MNRSLLPNGMLTYREAGVIAVARVETTGASHLNPSPIQSPSSKGIQPTEGLTILPGAAD